VRKRGKFTKIRRSFAREKAGCEHQSLEGEMEGDETREILYRNKPRTKNATDIRKMIDRALDPLKGKIIIKFTDGGGGVSYVFRSSAYTGPVAGISQFLQGSAVKSCFGSTTAFHRMFSISYKGKNKKISRD